MSTLALPMEIETTSDQWIGVMGPYGQNDRWQNERLGVTIWRVSHPTALYPYFIHGREDLGTFAHLSDAKAKAREVSR